jgi:hypothetical protein
LQHNGSPESRGVFVTVPLRKLKRLGKNSVWHAGTETTESSETFRFFQDKRPGAGGIHAEDAEWITVNAT